MMRIRLLMVALFSLAIISSVFAQKKELKGKITDASTGDPVAGATVMTNNKVSGSAKNDGTFSIQVSNAATSLIVSAVGYSTQTVEIKGGGTVDVKLVPSSTTMEDVVVIGYGTQKKSHLTGSVAKLKNEKLDEAPVPRLDQAMQGRIAGVQVQNVTSEAGADTRIRVRGISSINAGADPLVVVDGQPIPDGLSFVNPADVESIEVLKDAASAAIYGSRGASGVIIITTKSGRSEKAKYSLKTSTGFKTAYELYPMLTTTEYTNLLFYEGALKQRDTTITPPTANQIINASERAAYVLENTIMGGHPTNWQQEALRNGQVRNVLLNVSGGSRLVKYFVSGAYQKDEGMMYHSNFDRLTLRTKMDAQLSNKVKLTVNINPSLTKRERPANNFIDFVRFYSFIPVRHTEASAAFVNQVAQWADIKPGDFAQARHFNNRVYSGYMPDGTYWTNTAAVSPFNSANNTPKSVMESRNINTSDYRMQASGDLTVDLGHGLSFKTLASTYVNYTDGLDFSKRNATSDGSISKGVYSNRLVVDLLSENTFNYTRTQGKHNIAALAGFTAQKTTNKYQQVTGLDYPSDNITTLNTALQIDQAKDATYNYRTPVGLLSGLGRINYSYGNRYLFSASIRADGSSYFGPGQKWGYFPAFSAGWLISEEKFMRNVTFLNQLKLRGSWGKTGNNRIQDFAFVDLLYAANYSLGSGTGSVTNGQAPSSSILANELISWETTRSTNLGLDLAFKNNRITASLDVYQSKTQSLLLQQATQLFTGVPLYWNNIGRLQNRGIELEVTSNNVRNKNFRWVTNANIARNVNKILQLGDESRLLNQGERTELYQNRAGDPLIQFYGYKTDGVWLSQAQIDAAKGKGLTSALSNLFTPGGLKLVDVNGDNVIDDQDRVVMGNPYPDFTWGINNSINFKSFDLSFLVQGSQGGELINGDPFYTETKRINKNYISNRWLSPMNPGDGKTPYSTVGMNWLLTDYVVEDASYYALREVIVGYTLPSKAFKAVKLSGARIYFTAQNLYYHMAKGYRGINPEGRFTSGPYSSPLLDGYQRGSFPLPKTFLFGIDLSF